ncbi:hypothetical protein KEM48_003925 [Puccinia striiformis f. sp. tritici PST-130]|nr:hypothetical protein KEM48_003925 [Puccinia striiformis f. sp. tritici PST-130]
MHRITTKIYHPQHSSTSTTTNERSKAGVIRKMIKLSRTSRPDLPARQIAHIQYRGWPDFDVPPAAQDVIELIQLCQSTCTEIHNLNSSAIQDYLHQNSQQNNLTGKMGTKMMIMSLKSFIHLSSLPKPSTFESNQGPRSNNLKIITNHQPTYPIMAVVNEMREQRMSMVANYRQYVFLHEVLLTYMIQELNIPICEPIQSSSMTTTTTATMGMMSMTEEEVEGRRRRSMSQTDLHQKSSSTRSVDRYDNAPPPNHRLFTQSPDIHDPIDNHNVDIDNDHRMSIGTNDHQLPTSSSSIHTDSNHSSSSTTSINHDNFLSPLLLLLRWTPFSKDSVS